MTAYDELVDEVQDILPLITARQATELQNYIDAGEHEIARFFLSYIANTARHCNGG